MMVVLPRPSRTRLPALLTSALLTAGAALSAGAAPAGNPVPDFDAQPPCVADVIAVSCFATGSATGGGTIVSWDWEYPGLLGEQASGQSALLRFATEGVFTVTLTVTDEAGRTGSITKPMVVDTGS